MTDESFQQGSAPDEPMWGRASNLGRLEQRVVHTENDVAEIKNGLRSLDMSIKDLNSVIANIGKPQYQIWGVFGTLFCTITAGAWWLAINPINERVRYIESIIVPREVHVEKWAQADRETLRLESEIASLATKDDLNRLIIEIDRRLPKK